MRQALVLLSHYLDSVHLTPPLALGVEGTFKCANFLLVGSLGCMLSKEKDLRYHTEEGWGLSKALSYW